MRRVAVQRRKASKWWNEEVGKAVAEKRTAFEEWFQRRDGVTMTDNGHRSVVVKLAEWKFCKFCRMEVAKRME